MLTSLDCRVDVLRGNDRLESYVSGRAWNGLLERNHTNSIFQTFEWNKSWWNAYRRHFDLYCVRLSDKNGLAGLLPLMLQKTGEYEKNVLFIGCGNADYSDLILPDRSDEAVAAMFAPLLKESNMWSEIRLTNIPEESGSVEIIKKECSSAGLYVITDVVMCPVLKIAGHAEFATKLTRKKSINRQCNRLRESGVLQFRNIEDPVEGRKFLDTLINQHRARWKNSSTPSLFEKNDNIVFYHNMLSEMWHLGWLVLSVLEHNGRPISLHLGFDYESRVIWYKPSFDNAYSRYSPGKVMLKHLIEFCIESKKKELDFTIGQEPFKEHYTNQTRRNVSLTILKSRVAYSSQVFRRIMSALLRKHKSGRKANIA